MSKIQSRLVVKPKIIESICWINQIICEMHLILESIWSKRYTHFWPYPIITKLTLALAFLTLYQHAKKSAYFINSLSWDTADFRVPQSKKPRLLLTTATQKNNNKHDWSLVKHLNVLHYNKYKSSCETFPNILQKFNKLPFFGYLHMPGYFHQKSIIQLEEIFILMDSEMNSIYNFFLEML